MRAELGAYLDTGLLDPKPASKGLCVKTGFERLMRLRKAYASSKGLCVWDRRIDEGPFCSREPRGFLKLDLLAKI
jgi:hypothetical protein